MFRVLAIFLILAPTALLAEVTKNSFGVSQGSGGYSTITSVGNTTLATMDEGKTVPGTKLGCEADRNGKVGFCASKCGNHESNPKPVKVSNACADYIDRVMAKCLKQVGCHDRAVFCGVGGHAARMANTPDGDSEHASNHSVGDALDIFGLRCYGKDKKSPVNVDFTKAVHDKGNEASQVYKGLVKCWREEVRAYRSKTGIKRGDAIACEGHSKPANKKHNDHIHISCPVSRGGYKPPLIAI